MDRPHLAHRLRRIVHLVLALCAVVVILAKFPGRRIYDDANDCFRNGLAELTNTEEHGGHCRPSYTQLRGTAPAGGWRAIGFAIVVALGAGIVHRRPTRKNAVGWVIWTALAGVVVAALVIDFNIFSDVVEVLWPSHVVAFAIGMIFVLVLVATPIVVFATREQPSGSLPSARGSTGSR